MRKYSIGIDLGTTNCVVGYVELESDSPRTQLLPIPQITAPQQTESPTSLPSFLTILTEQEVASKSFVLHGHASGPLVVGQYAREVSVDVPERTVAAAKSWLCHAGVDRHLPILPWGSDEEITKLSPVTSSKLLLRHLVDAWHAAHLNAPLAEQTVTLTVPASFDMAARELTREAALAAGLPDDFILLEEPQAAVYNWLEQAGEGWRKAVQEGDSLLVCDVGGGTTDLTLVSVQQDRGDLALRRLAVGNHLLVGGDNMDLTLAHYVAGKFAAQGTQLNAWQSTSLWHACRRAKEALLSPPKNSVEHEADLQRTEKISVLGRGSKLIGGTVSVEVSKLEVRNLLIDGFLPICEPGDSPVREPHSGFREMGLPFEADTAITRHIAAFLAANEVPADSTMHLLLNGGVFKSPALQSRLRDVVAHLRGGMPTAPLQAGPKDLDNAVARGAAFYGWTKQRGGVRIRGGTARSYYVGIESAGLAIPGMPRPLQALCVVPFGMEEGSEADVPGREVGLVVGREAKFRFFAAAHRKEDKVGTTLKFWNDEELIETSPMEIKLDVKDLNADESAEQPAENAASMPAAKTSPSERFVPVRFHSRISELGVFELWCKSSRDSQQWKLEFDIRDEAASSSRTADAAESKPAVASPTKSNAEPKSKATRS